jgi:hypothetical protein
MAGPGRGGKGATNVPKLKGAKAQGSRPSGSDGWVPNAQYPTVLETHKLPMTPGPFVPGGEGETTINSTPAKD